MRTGHFHHFVGLYVLISILTLIFIPFAGSGRETPSPDKSRIIIETDAPGGDPDDEASLVRFFLYLNEWDVQGLIGTRSAQDSRLNISGKDRILQYIDDYDAVYATLKQHAAGYPEPDALRNFTKQCYQGSEARDLVIAMIDKPDPRPVWYLNWGTNEPDNVPTALRQALDYVRKHRGPAEYRLFAAKIRYVEVYLRDFIGEHRYFLSRYMDTFYPTKDGGRWYHRWQPLTETAGGFDVEKDITTGHGPLCANYTIQKEGDTPTFMFLIPNGLNEPVRPDWGGWSGRYSYNNELDMWWCDQRDTWNGTTNRDNTLKRWAAQLQNDFRARADWCVAKRYVDANHPPVAVLQGDDSGQPVFIRATAEEMLQLSAEGSHDPDGDDLSYEWIYYPEAGTYGGALDIDTTHSRTCTVRVPPDAAGKDFHVILEVTDRGYPPLTRYRRAIVTGAKPEG